MNQKKTQPEALEDQVLSRMLAMKPDPKVADPKKAPSKKQKLTKKRD